MHPDVTIYILMNDFCNRLKNLRKSAGITQQSMADGLNVHLQTVSKWERGISEPDISQLGDLARILGVTLEELLGESEGEETFSGAFDAVKLGSAISSARSAAGESQEQLSALLCVSADSVSRWERGVTCPDITCLCRLAEHFDVPVSKLYFGVQNQARPAAITVKRDSKYRRLVIVLSIALFMAVVAIILQSVLLPGHLSPVPDTPPGIIDTPGEETPDDNMPDDNMPDDNTPGEETPDDNMPDDNMPDDNTPDDNTPDDNTPDDNTPDDNTPGEETPGEETPDDNFVEIYVDGEIVTVDKTVPYTPETPVREGWDLLYWEDNDGNKINFPTLVEGGEEYWSTFIIHEYYIDYWVNGGEFETEPQYYITIFDDAVELATPYKSGDTFEGWYLTPDYSGEPVEYVECQLEDINVYAKWSDTVYEIRYERNGGKLSGEHPYTATGDSAVTLGEAVRDGYIFLGWYDSPEGGTRYETVGGEDAKNLTLYARWESYEESDRYYNGFIFESDGSSVVITEYVGESGEDIDLVIPATIGGLPVVKVGPLAPEEPLTYFNSVTIPEGIKILGVNAFSSLKVTEPIVIPSSVEEIEPGCFTVAFLDGIEFAAGSRLKTIGDSAFAGVRIDGVLQLPEGIEVIGRNAFYDAFIVDIRLPSTLRRIEAGGLHIYYDYTPTLFIGGNVEYIGTDAVTADYVYLEAEESAAAGFARNWAGESSAIIYGVQPTSVRLHVGDKVEELHGNYFILEDPVVAGYTFLGWQDASGRFVRRAFASAEGGDYYAVLEEQSPADGRTFDTMAVLEPEVTNTFIIHGNENYDSILYFRPNVAAGTEIVIWQTGKVYGGDNMHYVGADGTVTQVMPGNNVVIEEGGYFYIDFNELWTSMSMDVWYSVIGVY